MITKIKCYKVKVTPFVLDFKKLELVDISDQLEMPIYDTAQLDGVLDTSRISLINRLKMPLKPFTKIILELTDSSGTVEKIYRFVDNDNVENVVRGNEPIYRHTVSLIEATKLLERRTVDNLTFTNYLPFNYASNRVVPYTPEDESKTTVIFTATSEIIDKGYVGECRLRGPNIQVGSSIDTSWQLNLEVRVGPVFVVPFGGGGTHPLRLGGFTVITPSGKESRVLTSTYIFEEVGTYIFKQLYEYYEGVQNKFTRVCRTATWEVNVVENLDRLQEYSVWEVLERLLSVFKIRSITKTTDEDGNEITVGDSPEFILDKNIVEKLKRITSPEFSLTAGTLFEALYQVGEYIHAIPRLLPNVQKNTIIEEDGSEKEIVDDYSKWNIISFDFLGNKSAENEFKCETFSLIDLENPSDEFTTDFVSNVENATITNYQGKYAITEPFEGGFISLRTDSPNYEVSDNSAIAKTKEPIRSILSFKIKVDFGDGLVETYDITENVLEKTAYDTKLEYSTTNSNDMKLYFLCYEEGSPNIYGFTYTKPTATVIKQVVSLKETIKAIVNLYGSKPYEGNIKDISYQIRYIPYIDFKAKQFKPFIDKSAEKSTLFFNQQANEVDISHFGEAMHFALAKTGNVKYSPTQYFNSLNKAPKTGQWRKNYFCFQVNREISFQNPLKVTSAWSKDYNQLFADVAVKRAVRQSEIDKKNVVVRNVDFQEFLVVDTKLDAVAVHESQNESYNSFIANFREKIAKTNWGQRRTLNSICLKLSNVQSTNPITCAVCETKFVNKQGTMESCNFVTPVSCFPFGRSIVFTFNLDDNYSAGTTVKNVTDFKTEKDGKKIDLFAKWRNDIEASSIALEDYIPYVNEFGRCESITFRLVDKIDKSLDDVENAENVSDLYFEKKLYRFKRTQKIRSNFYAIFANYLLDKDSRERIKVTGQLNFVTPNPKINIYKAFVDSMPFVGDKETTLKYVVFVNKQDKFGEHVKGNYYQFAMPSVEYETTNKSIRIASVQVDMGWQNNALVGEGYGIVTNDNRLCLYLEKKIYNGDTLFPIYLMFRKDI